MSLPSIPAPTHPKPRYTRLILAALFVILLPGLVGLGWYISYRVSNTRAINRLEAKATKRGEPLTLAALAATYPPIPDEENAAIPLLELWQDEDPAYWRAFLAGQRPLPAHVNPKFDPDLPILGPKARQLSRTNQLPPSALAAAETYLKEQAEHMDALRAALRRPRFRFPIQITDGFGALLPHLSVMKSEAQRLRLEALVAAGRGDADAAINALTNAARTGHLLAGEPILISQLVRLACLALALDGAQHLLSQRDLTPAQLNRLDALFNDLKTPGTLRSVFITERASALSAFNLPAADLAQLSTPDEPGQEGVTPATYRAGMGVLTAIGLLGADRRLMLETFDQAIDLAEHDTPESLDRHQALFEQTEARARRFPPKIFTALLLPALQKVPYRFASLEARRRAAVTALAVQRYRLAHGGKPPDRLDQLVPQYLPSIPLDPYDGQPLRYRRLNPGYVIYSIGSDRADHGGKERPATGPAKNIDDTFTVGR